MRWTLAKFQRNQLRLVFLEQWILICSEGLDPRVLSWQERGWGSPNYECLCGKSCDISYFFFCILCNWAKTTNNPVTAITTQRPHPLLHTNHRGRAGWSHITMNAGWQDRACVKALPRHVVIGSGPQLYQECDKSSLNPEHPMEGQWETSTPALLLSLWVFSEQHGSGRPAVSAADQLLC